MSEEQLENVDSEIDAVEDGTTEEQTSTEDSQEETQDELSEREKQFLARAKKAEAKLKEQKAETKTEPNKTKESSEPDYSKIAFLNSVDVRHPDDQKAVMEEAARLKMPLTDVLGMEHMKAKLKNAKTDREIQDATPKGNGRSSGNTKGDVDYWLANGKTPDDLELASKVIAARMKQENAKNMFSDELYSG